MTLTNRFANNTSSKEAAFCLAAAEKSTVATLFGLFVFILLAFDSQLSSESPKGSS